MQKISDEHEIRVKAHQPAKNYINRAATLLLRDQEQVEEGQSQQKALEFVVFKASGVAIHTALVAADIIRRKVGGLHQINRIENITITDRRRKGSASDGEEEEEFEKQLAVFAIVLHKNPTESMKSEAGYIGELPTEEQRNLKLDEILYRRQNNYNNNNNYEGRNNRNQGGHQRRRRHQSEEQDEPRRRHNNERRHQDRDENRQSRKHSGDGYKGRENNRRYGNNRENYKRGQNNQGRQDRNQNQN